MSEFDEYDEPSAKKKKKEKKEYTPSNALAIYTDSAMISEPTPYVSCFFRHCFTLLRHPCSYVPLSPPAVSTPSLNLSSQTDVYPFIRSPTRLASAKRRLSILALRVELNVYHARKKLHSASSSHAGESYQDCLGLKCAFQLNTRVQVNWQSALFTVYPISPRSHLALPPLPPCSEPLSPSTPEPQPPSHEPPTNPSPISPNPVPIDRAWCHIDGTTFRRAEY